MQRHLWAGSEKSDPVCDEGQRHGDQRRCETSQAFTVTALQYSTVARAPPPRVDLIPHTENVKFTPPPQKKILSC